MAPEFARAPHSKVSLLKKAEKLKKSEKFCANISFFKIQPEDSEENSLVTSLVRCLKEFASGHRVDQSVGSH